MNKTTRPAKIRDLIKKIQASGLLLVILLSMGCQMNQEQAARHFEKLKEDENTGRFQLVYAYAGYLSSTKNIEIDFALSLLTEMMKLGYYTEARYCIDNLRGNGILSNELLYLHGVCYLNEMQYGLGIADLEEALKAEPDSRKIKQQLIDARALDESNQRKRMLDQRIKEHPEDPALYLDRAKSLFELNKYDLSIHEINTMLEWDPDNHEAYFILGMNELFKGGYNSAHAHFAHAHEIKETPEYEHYLTQTSKILEGIHQIQNDPSSFKGYILKSEGLAAIGLFAAAQQVLDQGIDNIPDNANLQLAKVLVWVQSGETGKARDYLADLEQRGMRVDPKFKQQVFKEQ